MKKLLLTVFLLGACLSAHADLVDRLPLGTVYSVDRAKGVVTIVNADTGKRHTYFLSERSTLSSGGETITIDQLRPGHAVVLDFKRTEIGRVIDLMRVPNLDQVRSLPAIDSDSKYFISGIVSGTRPKLGYVILRGPRINLRLSLFVPEGTPIMLNGKAIGVSKLKVGDVFEAEYQETVSGYELIKAEVERKPN